MKRLSKECRELVSLIIPVYNVENYIHQCLDSVINQTYSNIEILVIDDGSTDKSGKICDEYSMIDERITVFHTGNKGLSAARNYALDNCHGEYIAFLDSDDWIGENTIEQLKNSVISRNADIGVCGYYRIFNNHTSIVSIGKEAYLEGDNIMHEYLKGSCIGNVVWNKR